jgi:hypothetical protein
VIRAVKIELERLEGLVTEVGSVTCLPRDGSSVWNEAAEVLIRWRRTAPAGRGYHKVAFVVTYADGETYSGRYDMTAGVYRTIPGQMAEFLAYVGDRVPQDAREARSVAAAKAFLAGGYEIGHDSPASEAVVREDSDEVKRADAQFDDERDAAFDGRDS